MIEIYKVNESYFRLDGDQDYLKLIGNHYSFLSPGYKFSPSYKNKTPDGRRMWNGKVKLFKLTDKLFPAGLIQSLVEYLKEKGIYYNFNFNTSYMANKFSDGFFEKFYEILF